MRGHILLQVSIAVILLCIVVAKPSPGARAASVEDGDTFLCVDAQGEDFETDDWQTALDRVQNGGVLQVQRTVRVHSAARRLIPRGCTLIISRDAEFTPADMQLCINGSLFVHGTLDLSCGGVLTGKGSVQIMDTGRCVKNNSYTIEKSDSICLVGSGLIEGQALSDSVITQSDVRWCASVPGTWSFAWQSKIPETGLGLYDVCFYPDNEWTYDKRVFPSCGQVFVSPGAKTESGFRIQEKVREESDCDLKDSSGNTSRSEQLPGTKKENPVVFLTKMLSTPSTIRTAVNPSFSSRKVRMKKAVRKKDRIRIRWKQINAASGYQIQYKMLRNSQRYSFKKRLKKEPVHICRSCQKNILVTKGCKKIYVRVRGYQKRGKKRTYTKWSSIIQIKRDKKN